MHYGMHYSTLWYTSPASLLDVYIARLVQYYTGLSEISAYISATPTRHFPPKKHSMLTSWLILFHLYNTILPLSLFVFFNPPFLFWIYRVSPPFSLSIPNIVHLSHDRLSKTIIFCSSTFNSTSTYLPLVPLGFYFTIMPFLEFPFLFFRSF